MIWVLLRSICKLSCFVLNYLILSVTQLVTNTEESTLLPDLGSRVSAELFIGFCKRQFVCPHGGQRRDHGVHYGQGGVLRC